MPDETVRIVIQGDDKLSGPARTANAALGNLGTSAQKTMGRVEGMGTASAHASKSVGMLSIGLQGMVSVAAGIGVYRSVAEIMGNLTSFFGGAIGAASTMAESVSKMNVVFGDATPIVEKFANSAAINLGMAKQAAIEAAGTFGNLFQAMGLTQEEAANMSTALLQLTADLASFNNLRPEDVLLKLRAGLIGEAEPMRSLGVNINETLVKTKALQMGFRDMGGELSGAAKIQARYALILEQTSLAQGDFARTAEGMANTTRINAAKVADLQAMIGEKLLPVGLAWQRMQGGIIDRLSASGDALDEFARSIELGVTQVGAALGEIGGMFEDIIGGTIRDAAGWGWSFIQEYANGIMDGAMSLIGDAARFVGDLIASWFQPFSPPKIVPDIDQWGAATMEEYLRGFAQADFGVFRDMSSVIESQLQAMVKLGTLPEEGLIPAIIGRKTDLAAVITMMRSGQAVSEELMDGLVAGFGRASGAVKDYLKAEMAILPATARVQQAQERLMVAQRRLADLRRTRVTGGALMAAEDEVELARDALELARDQESSLKNQAGLAKSLVSAMSDNKSLQVQMVEALNKTAKAAGGVGDNIKEGVKKGVAAAKENIINEFEETKKRVQEQVGEFFAPLREQAGRVGEALRAALGGLGIGPDQLLGISNALGRITGILVTGKGAMIAFGIAAAGVGLIFTGLIGGIAGLAAIITSPWTIGAAAIAAWQSNLGDVQKRWQALRDAFAKGGLTAVFGELHKAGSDLMAWLGNQVGPITDALGEWSQQFLNWIGPMIPNLIIQAWNIHMALIDWILRVGDALRNQLGKWASAFLAWIVPMIPGFLAAVGVLARRLFTWVEGQTGRLLDSLGEWASAFVDWIAPMIPDFLAKVGELASALVDWIIETVSPLVEKLGEWAMAFIEWVAPMIPKLIGALLLLLGAIMDWITAEAPGLVKKFIGEWVPAAIKWVAEAAIKIIPELLKLILVIGAWIITQGIPKLLTFAFEMGKAILEGLIQGLGDLAGALGRALGDGLDAAIKMIAFDIGPFHMRNGEFWVQWPEIPNPFAGGGQNEGGGIGRGGGGFGDYDEFGNPVPRQHGGPVFAGRQYLVGERGPELFVPRQSGNVVANNTRNSQDNRRVVVNVYGGDPKGTVDRFAADPRVRDYLKPQPRW